jgi:hypothetical protein
MNVANPQGVGFCTWCGAAFGERIVCASCQTARIGAPPNAPGARTDMRSCHVCGFGMRGHGAGFAECPTCSAPLFLAAPRPEQAAELAREQREQERDRERELDRQEREADERERAEDAKRDGASLIIALVVIGALVAAAFTTYEVVEHEHDRKHEGH